MEAGEAGLAGEEVLHGGLFEVALLGDEPIETAQQRIRIAQRSRYRALFDVQRERNIQRIEVSSVDVPLGRSLATFFEVVLPAVYLETNEKWICGNFQPEPSHPLVKNV